MSKAVQYFSDEYLEHCRSATPEQVLEFLENFRILHGGSKAGGSKSRLISIKVPEDLLSAFKSKAAISNVPYQSKIKELMRNWIEMATPEGLEPPT